MNHIFGRKKAAAPAEEAPDLGATVSRIDGRVSALDAKIKQCDTELLDYKQKIARAKGAAKQGYQQRALAVLKRKRMYEQQRDTVAMQGFNVEQTSFALDSIKDTAETVKAMTHAATTLKQQMKAVDLGKIEDLQDELADLMADASEVQEIMSRSYGVPGEVDEDELMAELGALEDELAVEDDAAAVGVPSYLTDAPSGLHTDEYGLPVVPAAPAMAR